MYQLILFFHVLIAITLIALVLMNQGKGAGMGAAFGGGASQTVFGSQGSLSFMLKLTGFFAGLFFFTSILLTYMATYTIRQNTMMPTSTRAPISQPVAPASKNVSPNVSKNAVPVIPEKDSKTNLNDTMKKSEGSSK